MTVTIEVEKVAEKIAALLIKRIQVLNECPHDTLEELIECAILDIEPNWTPTE